MMLTFNLLSVGLWLLGAGVEAFMGGGGPAPYGNKYAGNSYSGGGYSPKYGGSSYSAPSYGNKYNKPQTPKYEAPSKYGDNYGKPSYQSPAKYGGYESKYEKPSGYQGKYSESKYEKPSGYQGKYSESKYESPKYGYKSKYEAPSGYSSKYSKSKYEEPSGYPSKYEGYESKYEKPSGYPSKYSESKYESSEYGYGSKYEEPSGYPSKYSESKYESPKYGYGSKYEEPSGYPSKYSESKYESPKYGGYESKYEEPSGYPSKYSESKYESKYESSRYPSKYESYEKPGYGDRYEEEAYPAYGYKGKTSEPCCTIAATKIEVTVLDDYCLPLEGACVHFADNEYLHEAKTDEDGVAVYTADCCKVHIMVTVPGYQSATREIYLDGDEICETYEKKVVIELEAKCTYKAWIYGVDYYLQGSAPGLVSYQYSCELGNDQHHVGAGQVVVAETDSKDGSGDCADDYTYAAVCLGGCEHGDKVTVKITSPGSDFISIQEVSGDTVGSDKAVALNVPPLSANTMLQDDELMVQINLYYMHYYVPCLVYFDEARWVDADGNSGPVQDKDATFGVYRSLSSGDQLLLYATLLSRDCNCDDDTEIDNQSLKGTITISNNECKTTTFEIEGDDFDNTGTPDVLLMACVCAGPDVMRVEQPSSTVDSGPLDTANAFDDYCSSACSN